MKETLDVLVISLACLMILVAAGSMAYSIIRYQSDVDKEEHRHVAESWEAAGKLAESERKRSRSGKSGNS